MTFWHAWGIAYAFFASIYVLFTFVSGEVDSEFGAVLIFGAALAALPFAAGIYAVADLLAKP